MFNISQISGVKLHTYLLNVVNRISFSSILQIWYVEVRISRSISDSPLEFEITRVDCIYIKCPIWLKTYDDFHIFTFFASALSKWKKSNIWQAYWLDLVGIYQYVKTYQNITRGLSAIIVFANWPRTHGRTHRVIIGHLESQLTSVGRHFMRLMQFCSVLIYSKQVKWYLTEGSHSLQIWSPGLLYLVTGTPIFNRKQNYMVGLPLLT